MRACTWRDHHISSKLAVLIITKQGLWFDWKGLQMWSTETRTVYSSGLSQGRPRHLPSSTLKSPNGIQTRRHRAQKKRPMRTGAPPSSCHTTLNPTHTQADLPLRWQHVHQLEHPRNKEHLLNEREITVFFPHLPRPTFSWKLYKGQIWKKPQSTSHSPQMLLSLSEKAPQTYWKDPPRLLHLSLSV